MKSRPHATTIAFALLVGCSSNAGSGGSSTNTNSSGGSGSSSGENTTSSGSSSGSNGGSSSGTTSAGSTSGASSGATSSSGGSTSSSSGGSSGETEVTCPTGVDGHCSMGVTYPTYSGYTLNLVEDFPSAVDLDNDPIFTWSDGSPESGQVRFREEQITFANGTMVITADNTCTPPTNACIPSSTSYAEPAYMMSTGTVGAMNVWSGEFRTKYNNYRYGRYEVRYQAPSPTPTYASDPGGNANDGNFLSTMFIFRTPKWLTWNEIDNELEPSIPTSVAYNVVNATNTQHYPGCAGTSPTQLADCNNAAGNTSPITGYANNQMHTYAFEWLPTGITWYLDGNVLPVATGAMFPSYANGQFTGKTGDPIPTLSAKIMMNLWIFGSSAAFGDPTKNQYPFHATYDYFHFYKWNQETTYPCSPTPSCLPAADVVDSQNNPKETGYPN